MSEQLSKEQLLMKAEGVKDCVKWIQKKIKQTQQDRRDAFGCYDDKTDYFEKINTLIDVKFGLEKYKRKLKHMADETNK